MSYGLRGRGGSLTLGINTWPTLLELAKQYGWEPMGTEPNIDVYQARGFDGDRDTIDWSGGYVTNDWQIVTDRDAKNLAASLRRFLSQHPKNEDLTGTWWAIETPEWVGQVDNLLQDIDGSVQAPTPSLDVGTIRELAQFAEAGEFIIV